MSDQIARSAEREYYAGEITYEELLRIKSRHGIKVPSPAGWLHAGSSHSHNTFSLDRGQDANF